MVNSKYILSSSVALIVLVQAASASNFANLSGDAPTSLSISQDVVAGNNSIGTPGAAFSVSGPMDTLAITQDGGGNALTGSIATANGTANSLVQTYSGGLNTATLAIGGKTPGSVAGSISVLNNSSATGNSVSETVDTSGKITFNIGIGPSGKKGGSTGNTISDTLQSVSGGAISDSQSINTNGNTVTNNITGADAISVNYAINGGSGQTINTQSTGGGTKSINISVNAASGNTVNTTLSGGGSNTVDTTLSGLTHVTYDLTASVASAASLTLNNVFGASGAAGVKVSQTGSGASLAYSLNGGTYAAGTIQSGPGAGKAIYISQTQPGDSLNASFNPTATGWTVNIVQ